ncbi:hypothetical protein Tco_0834824 [Tanacetum coccineum]
MTTLAEFMIIPGADNRPPMLEKFLYDSWKSGMEFYMENTENGIIILDSVQNGPLVWLTITEEDGTTRKKTYAGLSASEKLQADCDCKATNIVLQGLAIPVFNQVDDPNSCLNKAMDFLTTIASSRSHGEAMHGLRKRQYVILEVPHFEPYHTDMDNQSVHAMQGFEQTPVADHKWVIQRIKPTLYDGSVISSQHAACLVIDDEETLILEEVSRSKMLAKQNDPMSKEKKVITTLINYVELNRLSADFGKCFVPQKELSDEQAFWLQTSHPNIDQSTSSPVKIEAPRELPKVSLVNTSFKKLKYHLGKFDTVVKKRITPDAITEGEWRFEHTKTIFLNEIIPLLKTLKDIFNVFDKDLLNEVMEVQTIFNQMEAAVQ